MEKKYLPCSARRYHVTKYGIVYKGESVVDAVIIGGEAFVHLDWVAGSKHYNVATLVLLSHSLTELPDYLYESVRPIYKDGNKDNLRKENLCSDFGGIPLESLDFPGFFYIPGFSLYVISETGELINVKTRKYKSWSTLPPRKAIYATGSYDYTRLIRDDGISCTVFKHRALCLAFKPTGFCVDDYVVDHIDTNTQNNKLDNLEWVTYKENLLRAYRTGLRQRSSKPIDMMNVDTGAITQFATTQAAVDFINGNRLMPQPCTQTLVLYRISKCKGKVFPDRLVFKCKDEDWPVEITTGQHQECRAQKGEIIIARNVFTGKLAAFDNCRIAGECTGVKQATILTHVSNKKDLPVNGYNFRYLDDAKEWPHHSEKNLAIYKAFPIYPPNGAIATNLETGEEIFFESVGRCINAFNLSKSCMYDIIDTARSIKGYSFRSYDLRENLGPGLIKLDHVPS